MTQRQRAATERAIGSFRSGSPVLIHDADDREGETDLIYPAGAVTPEAVSRLRNDAGGLVCVALSASVAGRLDLPFVQETLDHPAAEDHDLAYDDRSSFSLTVNHRNTRTGITDADRALTITALSEAAGEPDPGAFAETFRAPGHVHLLRAAEGLLSEREGHTEFGVALAEAADLPPAVVVCEMLDDHTGGALSPADARAYAQRHDLPYLEGRDLRAGLGR
ncbi:3,4-dihydroxy-2-butanone-4-phosphate synthase [Halalkalicoccus jeotgali]|uniref:3,4-dihydroxy-2-butanone 4-phosphate synthase n=1 Tax=Halalkalicoccus jeotgali (strain DSM 18796 / CECT 7217 / JCM 14584 / KCTC 4019 / B3) TaxID=795797 RepID=D8J5Y2_HALJB|nr:3,4-dihydroxy-2-butanone-4-phosphate synthase [Halalkalicoccus jeotgali]ADJ13788.1 3,4-dihydroxy-2-butanone 4-phosphate synthase [Halalkalicoccus jeotgali B3]ELY34166.1 3,4-dihydroxy-2-butanone 4-phosphate synthase [Halalkalicoccus jeotgali B3]